MNKTEQLYAKHFSIGQSFSNGDFVTCLNDVSGWGYKGTIVVSYDWKEKIITLDSGTWRTKTTKSRMNAALSALRVDCRVCQKDYAWFVYIGERMVEFEDGMKLKVTEGGIEVL